MHVTLETKQQLASFRRYHPHRDAKLGDRVELRGDSWCPTCFGGNPHDAVECYNLFPPVVTVTVTGALDCATCANPMLLDTFRDGRKVIMCCNRHCPDQGTCYKLPTIRLERLFE